MQKELTERGKMLVELLRNAQAKTGDHQGELQGQLVKVIEGLSAESVEEPGDFEDIANAIEMSTAKDYAYMKF